MCSQDQKQDATAPALRSQTNKSLLLHHLRVQHGSRGSPLKLSYTSGIRAASLQKWQHLKGLSLKPKGKERELGNSQEQLLTVNQSITWSQSNPREAGKDRVCNVTRGHGPAGGTDSSTIAFLTAKVPTHGKTL